MVMSMGMAVMMLVTAMVVTVVMVAVIVIMVVIVMMARVMIVAVRMVVAGVTVLLMRMTMRGSGIGAALGIERRFDLDDTRAQPLHHRLDDVIPADAQRLRQELGRQMAVAEMPGDPDQVMRIASLDLEQRLGRRHHLDHPAVLEHQRIAAAQGYGVFEIEQKLQSARARHRHPPPVPVVEIQHDGVGRRFLPAMLPENPGRADHGDSLF